MIRPLPSFFAAALVFACATPSAAFAQSERASAASAASLASVRAVPSAALELLAAGGQLGVVALRPVGGSVQVVLAASADGASFVLDVAAASLAGLGLAVGSVVEISAVGAGWLLHVGAQALAFVPSPDAAALSHRRELSR